MSVLHFHNMSTSGSEGVILPSVPGNSGIQGVHCLDVHGRVIARGVHYVPGPDACVHCICDIGGPQLCNAILCGQPPEKRNCKPTRVGVSCCEFICPDDDWLTNGISPPVDMGIVVPKIIITAILSLLSISLLLFLVNRLRQRGRMAANSELRRVARMYDDFDTRSIDYALQDYSRNAAGFGYPPQYMAWWRKPYFPPTGEAPPPYEEAINSTALPMTTLPLPLSSTVVVSSERTEVASTKLDEPKTDKESTPSQNSNPTASASPHEVTRSSDPGPSSRIGGHENDNKLQDGASSKSNLPAYSDLVGGAGTSKRFRRSLTLPRGPHLVVTRRQEGRSDSLQRYSLPPEISVWNSPSFSSSSSPSPTQLSPNAHQRHDSPSPTSSSSSNGTN